MFVQWACEGEWQSFKIPSIAWPGWLGFFLLLGRGSGAFIYLSVTTKGIAITAMRRTGVQEIDVQCSRGTSWRVSEAYIITAKSWKVQESISVHCLGVSVISCSWSLRNHNNPCASTSLQINLSKKPPATLLQIYKACVTFRFFFQSVF